MPPKQRITKEMILEHAFEMLCENGMEMVNARSLARRLSCSTQPIFSYYSGMEELKRALRDRAQGVYDAHAAKAETYLDRCVAYMHFAEKEPMLFECLFGREKGSLPTLAEGEKPGVFAAAHGFAVMLVHGCGNATDAEAVLRRIDAAL